LPYRFTPRHYQQKLYTAFYEERKRNLYQVLHRGAGKTYNAFNFLLSVAIRTKGLYLHTFPTLKLARDALWEGMDMEGHPLLDCIPKTLIKNINRTFYEIELINGSLVKLYGTDYYNRLRGLNLMGCVFDEFAFQNPIAADVVRPRLVLNKGFALYITTPNGKNHAHQLFENNKDNPDWYVEKLSIEDTKDGDGNPIINQEMIDSERRAGYDENKIQAEYYCSFEAGVEGAYYSKQLEQAYKEDRIIEFDIDTRQPVFTFWDLGYSDYTSIWFVQFYENKIYLIHYYENCQEEPLHYCHYIKDWAKANKMHYGRHYAPHDAFHQTALGTWSGTCRTYGVPLVPVPKAGTKDSVQEGIQQVRFFFPKMIFHKINCANGISILQSYHKSYDEKNQTYRDKPAHDFASHGADAMRYLAMTCYHQLNNKSEFSREIPLGSIDL